MHAEIAPAAKNLLRSTPHPGGARFSQAIAAAFSNCSPILNEKITEAVLDALYIGEKKNLLLLGRGKIESEEFCIQYKLD